MHLTQYQPVQASTGQRSPWKGRVEAGGTLTDSDFFFGHWTTKAEKKSVPLAAGRGPDLL